MIVVADTSPLHYLILLEQAEVLQNLYGCVIIPEAVVRELQAQKTPAVVRLWITTPVLRQYPMRNENSAIPRHDGCLIQVIPSPSNAKNLSR